MSDASKYDLIHLADGEWGSELMHQIADEYFRANPECQFVRVYEHAGWFLGFRRDGTVWATANDSAVLTDPEPRPTGYSGKSVWRQKGRA